MQRAGQRNPDDQLEYAVIVVLYGFGKEQACQDQENADDPAGERVEDGREPPVGEGVFFGGNADRDPRQEAQRDFQRRAEARALT